MTPPQSGQYASIVSYRLRSHFLSSNSPIAFSRFRITITTLCEQLTKQWLKEAASKARIDDLYFDQANPGKQIENAELLSRMPRRTPRRIFRKEFAFTRTTPRAKATASATRSKMLKLSSSVWRFGTVGF